MYYYTSGQQLRSITYNPSKNRRFVVKCYEYYSNIQSLHNINYTHAWSMSSCDNDCVCISVVMLFVYICV